MSIQSEIDRLAAAKASIAASLQAMGVEPPEGTTLDQYAAQLAAIAAAAPWLPLAGGTMTGDIQMGGRRITGVGEPQEDTDVVCKGDLDSKLDAPDGGAPGQMLYQGESGAEWRDKPVMYVNITESGGTYSADKTAAEIYEAVQSGYAVFAKLSDDLGDYSDFTLGLLAAREVPAGGLTGYMAIFASTYVALYQYCEIIGGSDSSIPEQVNYRRSSINAGNISFSPSAGLTSTNVQDAIEEVAGKGSTGGVIYVNTFARASSWRSVEGGKYQIEIDVRNSISQELYHELLIADDRDLLIVVNPDPADLVGVEDFNEYGIYYYMRSSGTTFSLRAKSQPTYNIGILINIIRRTEATPT